MSSATNPLSDDKPNYTPKASENFYECYLKNCCQMKMDPLSYVKPHDWGSQTVLNLRVDTIPSEQWEPICNALREDRCLTYIAFRCHVIVDSFKKVDLYKQASFLTRRVSIYKNTILENFLESLEQCIKINQVVNCLELDGIPVCDANIIILLRALKYNKSMRTLSIKHCNLKNTGCHLICSHIKNLPNIEILNLSSCNLEYSSGQYISNLIRHQKDNILMNHWPVLLGPNQSIKGLKHIILNNNPKIGDKGLQFLLEVIKSRQNKIQAIEMQECGLTENIAENLLVIISASTSLLMANFYSNYRLSKETCDKISAILNSKKYQTDCTLKSHTTSNSIQSVSSKPLVSTINLRSQDSLYELNKKIGTMGLSPTRGIPKLFPPPNFRAIVKTNIRPLPEDESMKPLKNVSKDEGSNQDKNAASANNVLQNSYCQDNIRKRAVTVGSCLGLPSSTRKEFYSDYSEPKKDKGRNKDQPAASASNILQKSFREDHIGIKDFAVGSYLELPSWCHKEFYSDYSELKEDKGANKDQANASASNILQKSFREEHIGCRDFGVGTYLGLPPSIQKEFYSEYSVPNEDKRANKDQHAASASNILQKSFCEDHGDNRDFGVGTYLGLECTSDYIKPKTRFENIFKKCSEEKGAIQDQAASSANNVVQKSFCKCDIGNINFGVEPKLGLPSWYHKEFNSDYREPNDHLENVPKKLPEDEGANQDKAGVFPSNIRGEYLSQDEVGRRSLGLPSWYYKEFDSDYSD